MCSIEFHNSGKSKPDLQLRLHPVLKCGYGSKRKRQRKKESMLSDNTQLRFAMRLFGLFYVDDVSVCSLPNAQPEPTRCNNVFGVQPGKLPEQKHESKNVR